MATQPLINSVPLLLLFLAATSMAAAALNSSASPDFVRASCATTLYPDLCFSSLAHRAGALQQNPLSLARAACDLSASRLRSLSSRVSSLSRAGVSSDPRASGALKDCADLLRDAWDLTRQSWAELGGAGTTASGGSRLAWTVANAQTWMSAALTNEDTCMDGWEGVSACWVKEDVQSRVARAEQLSSNALALVNKLVN